MAVLSAQAEDACVKMRHRAVMAAVTLSERVTVALFTRDPDQATTFVSEAVDSAKKLRADLDAFIAAADQPPNVILGQKD